MKYFIKDIFKQAANCAYGLYANARGRKEKTGKLKQEEKQKEKNKTQERQKQYELKLANSLFREATDKLTKALLENNFKRASVVRKAFQEMRSANCKNCDKYFHCSGNYNAVFNCHRSDLNRKTAEIISNCREDICGGPDSASDQQANRYGRSGGNCTSRYLCKNDCQYNPQDRTCRETNC
ncbi:hypothetical protein LSH36_39g12013 [Paralvinella palmiformis]|uniref:Uncharacterized protein n=1 Tax=Paralvinella palmiformis TaxID=53620 RepID=A0AAD9NDY3_9ANNE|nr:hypothetical protein LSH36_39g12013 [Paralvinella palmiformis]